MGTAATMAGVPQIQGRREEIRMSAKTLISMALLLGSIFVASFAQAAAVIVGGPQCNNAPCQTFYKSNIPLTIRPSSFTAPSSGRVAVSITASMYCQNVATSSRTVDLVTQITSSPDAVPSISGPGALRHYARLGANDGTGADVASFNLGSTRVFSLGSAGKRYFYLNVSALKFDYSVFCKVYDGAFTYFFVP